MNSEQYSVNYRGGCVMAFSAFALGVAIASYAYINKIKSSAKETAKIESQLIELITPAIQRTNIIKDSTSELYIDINGKRFYAEIDGKSIEDYLSNSNQ